MLSRNTHAVENRALADFEAPDRLAGVHLKRVEHAIRAADEQEPRPVHIRHDRRRVVRVVVTRLRRADPHRLTGPLVEREVPIPRTAQVRAPVLQQRVQNDFVTLDDRRRRPAAMRRDRTVFLRQGTAPYRLAIGSERDELGGDGEHVDVAGGRIDGRRGPTRPVLRHVGEVEAERSLPDDLAAIDIDGDEPFLRRRHVTRRDGLQVQAIAEHNRRRSAAKVERPGDVLPGGRPARRQIGFRRRAIAPRSAPFRPIVRRQGGPCGQGHE